jgi:phenylpropionate dioxygenase-like ring-hydroxylating dioxygenase large terminal subunit
MRPYVDADVYERERDAVFGHSWLFVGHESMIPHPGDFVTNYMGDDPVIVSRDRDGSICVLLNKCRHRGNKLCLYDRGNTKAFRCAYHGWTYDNGGDLAAVPHLKEAYGALFDRQGLGLIRPPKVDTHGGLIFACWDAAAKPLAEFLGTDTLWYLDNFLLDDPEGLEVLPMRHRYIMPGNWKLMAENFGGDGYHFNHTHASLNAIAKKQTSKRIPFYEDDEGNRFGVTCTGDGHPPHGFVSLMIGEDYFANDCRQAKDLGPEALRWVEARFQAQQERLAAYSTRPYSFHVGNIWPNLAMVGVGTSLYGRTFLQIHPRGPDKSEVWQWCFVPKSAPPEVKQRMAFVVTQRQSAAGMTAPDDAENFLRIRDAMRGRQARDVGFHYGLGLATDAVSVLPELPGIVQPRYSEYYQREFYRYWTELITG